MEPTPEQVDMSTLLAPIGFGLMCKPPRPGISKTRLAADIGAEAAAKLSAAFLADCAHVASSAATRSSLMLTAFYKPEDAAKELAEILGPSWPLEFADAASLGMIMRDIMERLLTKCPAGAMLMGADIPMIDADVIDCAADRLRNGDERSIVIAPSADGGYCLIGVRTIGAAAPLLEDMAWSTPRVLEETLRRARAEGLHVTLLDTQRDVDDLKDLHWLRHAIASQPECASASASATRKVLAQLALPQR